MPLSAIDDYQDNTNTMQASMAENRVQQNNSITATNQSSKLRTGPMNQTIFSTQNLNNQMMLAKQEKDLKK